MANEATKPKEPIQKKENKTGLPDPLKSGIEHLSGHSMDDVKVHYNSNQPAQLNAHAYAQGTDIHLGPGQEKHLPHEAWHVVQQKQGRVQPTKQLKSKVQINDDKDLEKEADVMGAKAHAGVDPSIDQIPHQLKTKVTENRWNDQNAPIQRMIFNLANAKESEEAEEPHLSGEGSEYSGSSSVSGSSSGSVSGSSSDSGLGSGLGSGSGSDSGSDSDSGPSSDSDSNERSTYREIDGDKLKIEVNIDNLKTNDNVEAKVNLNKLGTDEELFLVGHGHEDEAKIEGMTAFDLVVFLIGEGLNVHHHSGVINLVSCFSGMKHADGNFFVDNFLYFLDGFGFKNKVIGYNGTVEVKPGQNIIVTTIEELEEQDKLTEKLFKLYDRRTQLKEELKGQKSGPRRKKGKEILKTRLKALLSKIEKTENDIHSFGQNINENPELRRIPTVGKIVIDGVTYTNHRSTSAAAASTPPPTSSELLGEGSN